MVMDRIVQQAVAQIPTPIFERVFSDNSFGFRPHRGAYACPAKQSQRRVKKALKLLTKRNRGISLIRMFEEIHQKMCTSALLNWETN